jgi:hypothetical protein
MKIKTNIRAGSGGSTSGGVNSGGVKSGLDSTSSTTIVYLQGTVLGSTRCVGV